MQVDVAGLISRIMNESRQVPKMERAQETTPQEPAAKFTPSSPQQLLHQVYNAKGGILKLGQFSMQNSLALSSSALQKSVFSGIELTNPVVPTFTLSDTVGASLLQQIFDFLKQNFQLKDQKKRKKKTYDPEISNEAEQRARDLLEDFLELAEQSEDIFAFCVWARLRIQNMESELRERVSKLPPEVERSFKIMTDAILAMENGVSPSYIRERLDSEIQRKSELND